jgi:hypothetical protein
MYKQLHVTKSHRDAPLPLVASFARIPATQPNDQKQFNLIRKIKDKSFTPYNRCIQNVIGSYSIVSKVSPARGPFPHFFLAESIVTLRFRRFTEFSQKKVIRGPNFERTERSVAVFRPKTCIPFRAQFMGVIRSPTTTGLLIAAYRLSAFNFVVGALPMVPRLWVVTTSRQAHFLAFGNILSMKKFPRHWRATVPGSLGFAAVSSQKVYA